MSGLNGSPQRDSFKLSRSLTVESSGLKSSALNEMERRRRLAFKKSRTLPLNPQTKAPMPVSVYHGPLLPTMIRQNGKQFLQTEKPCSSARVVDSVSRRDAEEESEEKLETECKGTALRGDDDIATSQRPSHRESSSSTEEITSANPNISSIIEDKTEDVLKISKGKRKLVASSSRWSPVRAREPLHLVMNVESDRILLHSREEAQRNSSGQPQRSRTEFLTGDGKSISKNGERIFSKESDHLPHSSPSSAFHNGTENLNYDNGHPFLQRERAFVSLPNNDINEQDQIAIGQDEPGSPWAIDDTPSSSIDCSKLPFAEEKNTMWNSTLRILLLVLSILGLGFLWIQYNQIGHLKEEISTLEERLKNCANINDGAMGVELHIESNPEEWIAYLERHLVPRWQLAMVLSLLLVLSAMFIVLVKQGGGAGGGGREEEEACISKRIAYRVDVLFSTYAYVKPLALLGATFWLIALGGVVLHAWGGSEESLVDSVWRSWTYVADSGSHADSQGAWHRIIGVTISIGGMLIFALMLGLISDAISEKVDSLRKGKSEVLESAHTLILGWSDKLGSLLKQLAIANQSLGGGVVVVLAERDKEQMESDIANLEFDFMGTKVICRSGSPLIMADLKKVSVSKARAIIILAEVENADQSDARALRVVLSLTGVKEGLRAHVVVELSDVDNEPLVKLVGGDLVETVVAHDVIGRLMIQCARQPGLAQIWEDMLGFENAEFYIKHWPQLIGTRFEDVLISFPDAIPCGVKMAAEGGKIVINPDDDYVIKEGDEIFVIAEDDDSYAPSSSPAQVRKTSLALENTNTTKKARKILLCGWRRDIEDMIQILEAFLAPGSELWIFCDLPEDVRNEKLRDGGLNTESLVNISLKHRQGNTVIRRHLEELPLETFDSILILADEAFEESVVNADSRSLATTLLIRDIQSKRLPLKSGKPGHVRDHHSESSWIREMQQASDRSIIISEILDSRTRNLVSVSKIGDYVLSNELVSMALAMVAEDKQINRVLEELFSEEGNELYIRPAELYVYDQEELSFFEIMVRARERREIVIGYRRRAYAERAVINPPDKVTRYRWSSKDTFVVLAEDE